jgi:hypothetical protein
MAEPPAASAPGGQSILDEGSPWRMSAWWDTPLYRDKDGTLKPVASDQDNDRLVGRTAPLPPDWMSADFVDDSWSRWSGPRSRQPNVQAGIYGFWMYGEPGPTLATLCLRGRFVVDDPAAVRGLTLSIAYRGGAVVYVNGQEVARRHLPKDGKIAPDAMADDYP